MPGQITYTPVLPTSLNRAKKSAKQLQRFFPDSPLFKCQKAVAILHGYKDWHALELACDHCANAGTYDEDLDEKGLRLRRLEQAQALMDEFAATELLSFCARRPGWNSRYTWLVVVELDITRLISRALPDFDLAQYSMIDPMEYAQMWTPLNDWALRKNNPALPPLPTECWSLHIGKLSPASLWLASGLVGSWLADNSGGIPRDLAFGMAYILADQYASLVSLLVFAEDEHTDIDPDSDYFMQDFYETRSDAMLSFFSCFALPDCDKAYAEDPRRMAKYAVDAIAVMDLSEKLLFVQK